jgi:mono/diheme cytochrome c family protein
MKISPIIVAILLGVSVVTRPSGAGSGSGAEIFQEKCAGCHGPDGRAQTYLGKKIKAADLTSDAVQQQNDAQLLETVQDGKKKMPAFKGKLGETEIHAVVAYVRELAKKH